MSAPMPHRTRQTSMTTGRTGKHMTNIQRNVALLSAFVTLAAALISGCGSGKGDAVVSRHVVPVEGAVAVRTHISVTKMYSGPIEGEEQANIVSKLSERVTAIHARVGKAVPAGAVILGLDRNGVSSQYFQAEAGYKNAEVTLKRMKSLYGEGAVSLQTLDGAQMGFDVAKANFGAARGAVDLATPIAGLVTAVNVNIGDLAVPGTVLATVARVDKMKIIFTVNETDIPMIEMGHAVVVYTDVNPEARAEGRIVQLSKSADIRSRSFEVKALFPNRPDRWFKPGMFGKVRLEISPKDEMLVIPASAIQSDGSSSRVFVVRGGRSYLREIDPGVSDGERTVVLRGLAPGDTVATVGANNLKDSCDVALVAH
jgi:membrane fusion protein, multidrug efflux system